MNAARLAHEHGSGIKGEPQSDDEDDEDSEGGAPSLPPSKRNSLMLNKDAPPFTGMLDEKTPTVATLLSQAQAAGRPGGHYPAYAPIRRRGATPQEVGQQQQQQQQQPVLVPTQSPSPVTPHQAYSPSGPSPGSVRHLPHFPTIDEAVGGNSTTPHSMAARELWSWFQDHLDALLESIRTFRFDQFEMAIRTFWATLGPNHREVAHAPAIAGLMAKADAIVYDVSRCSVTMADPFTDAVGLLFDRKSWRTSARRCSHTSRPIHCKISGIWPSRWSRSCSSRSTNTAIRSLNPKWSSALASAISSVRKLSRLFFTHDNQGNHLTIPTLFMQCASSTSTRSRRR